jgi:hypothetical protein
VNEAGGDPARAGARDIGGDPFEEGGGGVGCGRAAAIGAVEGDAMIEQTGDIGGVFEVSEALEGADADMAVAEPDQDGGEGSS